jgi:hypothetical protein
MFFSKTSRPDLEPPQPPIQEVLNSLSGVKLPWRDVDHSPIFSAKVKNELSYTCIPPICLHGTDGDNFTFCYRAINISKYGKPISTMKLIIYCNVLLS